MALDLNEAAQHSDSMAGGGTALPMVAAPGSDWPHGAQVWERLKDSSNDAASAACTAHSPWHRTSLTALAFFGVMACMQAAAGQLSSSQEAAQAGEGLNGKFLTRYNLSNRELFKA